MLDPTIHQRLVEAIKHDGRSFRAISKAAGLGPNFVHQLVTTPREPGVDQFVALCRTLNVSVGKVLYGSDVSAEGESLAHMITALDDDQRQLLADLARKLRNGKGG